MDLIVLIQYLLRMLVKDTHQLQQLLLQIQKQLVVVGTYQFNEVVQGMRSGTQARVKNWDADTGILSISNVGIGTTTTGFFQRRRH